MTDIINLIREAHRERNVDNIHRRMMKIGEEYGELLQAWLSVTSKKNSKGKTWDQVREEMVDVIVVAVDVLETRLPSELDLSDEQLQAKNLDLFLKKLEKWKSSTSSTVAE